eukprot:EG_transcript_9026
MRPTEASDRRSRSSSRASRGTFRGLRSLDSQTAFLAEAAGHAEGYATHPFRAGFFTLTNTILGGGISLISLPLATRSAGLVLGPVLLVFAACVTGFTLVLLTDCRVHTGLHTFHELGQRALGRHAGALTIKASIVANNFTVCIALFLVVADVVLRCSAENGWGLPVGKTGVLWLAFALVLPLALCRHLASLQYACAAAIAGVFAFLFMAVVTVLTEGAPNMADLPPLAKWTSDALFALPLCCLAFACQFILLPIVNTCPPRTVEGVMPPVIVASVAVSCVLYIVAMTAVNVKVAGGPLDGNVLMNYSVDVRRHPQTAATIMAFTAALLLTIPVFHFECRENLDALLFPADYDASDDEAEEPEPDSKDGVYGALGQHPPSAHNPATAEGPAAPHPPPARFVLLSGASLLAAMLVASAVTNVDVVLGYLGATVCVTVSYILPSLLYLRLMARKGWKWYGAAAVLALGVALVPTLVAITTIEVFGLKPIGTPLSALP